MSQSSAKQSTATQPSAVQSMVLKGGEVIDGSGRRRADVVVEDGRIVAVGADLSGDVIIDCGGCLVSPGFV
ncbi:MAG: hypothetical protein AB7V43_19805, partial [Acidimicrobiia bacterium]